MTLRVFNTQTGRKEDFKSVLPGRVGMYVCGVTVYDLCHIGHARSAVVFDVVYRYLAYSGLSVTYVRNFTDVDDKIIKRAGEEGISSSAVAEKYIAAFYEDMDRLNVLRPDVEPRATAHVDDMIAHVAGLVENGNAYVVDGDVYFSVDSFKPYGKLSGRNLDDLMAGARVEVDERKRNALDFALWKAAKPGEPSWESPWGPGRPGWHIECSVMSQKYLGHTLDIHGGGKDLVFPHHENEVAQAEALTGKPFVNYWLHNGFVNIDKEKMSKSLGNFFTIRDVLKKVHPEVLRYFLLSHHYRSPVDYSDTSLTDAKAGLDRLYGLTGRLEEAASGASPAADAGPLAEALKTLIREFSEAMDDDFNTAGAIGQLHVAARAVGAYLHEGGSDPAVASAALEAFRKVGKVLGILEKPAAEYEEELKADAMAGGGVDAAWVEGLIRERADSRKAKNFARADEIRKELLDRGIVLEDGPQGTTWKVK